MQNRPDVGLPEDLPVTWTADVALEDLPITTGLLDMIEDERLK